MEVSIIMPAYNAASVVGASIRSVVAQEFAQWELIVVDDHSSDDTVARVEAFARQDGRIRLIQLPQNGGPAVARNAAIAAARGRYLAFLDCDDLWLPAKLGRQLEFMQASGAAFSYGAYYEIDADGHRCGRVDVPSRTTYRELLKTNVIGCLTAMYDTASVGRVFMPGIRKGQDYGLWLALLKRVDHACGMTEPLAEYRVQSGSISANKLESSLWVWRVYREVERLSLPRAAYYFAHYAFHGVRDRVAVGRRSGGHDRRMTVELSKRAPGSRRWDRARRIAAVLRERGLRFIVDYFVEVVWFDVRHGTDTFRHKPGTAGGGPPADGVHYVASFTSVVNRVLDVAERVLGERFASAQFVDLGCGKAKALLVYELRRRSQSHPPALGVEFDADLVAVALRNLERIRPAGAGATIVCDDAARLGSHLSGAPLIVYLYNPFGRATLHRVLDELARVEHVVLYVDPTHRSELLDRGYAVVEEHVGRYRADTWVVARPPPRSRLGRAPRAPEDQV